MFYPVQLQDLKLTGAGISAGATSITVQSLKIPNTDTLVTMADFGDIGYGVLEPGTSKEEVFSFTGITQNGNGTATFTGVTTGINFVTPYDSQVTLKYGHAGNAIVRISNVAAFFQEFAKLKNDETITGTWTFDNTTRPLLDVDVDATDDEEFVTKGELLRTALGTVTTNKVIISGIAGEAITAGQVVYLDETDNEWKLADASASATSENIMLGIAQGVGSNGVAIDGGVLILGRDENQAGLTQGDLLYLSDTSGAISSTPGTKNVVLGYAVTATTIDFQVNFKRFLTKDQQDALAGTSGTPSTTNEYVTENDTTNAETVTDTTIAFVNATSTITDSNSGLAGFRVGASITVSGSASNDGTYTVTAVAAGVITVAESLIDESAGASVTITAVTTNKVIRNNDKLILLSSIPTNGDVLYYNSTWQTLAKGLDNQVLSLDSGLPSWKDNFGSTDGYLVNGYSVVDSGASQVLFFNQDDYGSFPNLLGNTPLLLTIADDGGSGGTGGKQYYSDLILDSNNDFDISFRCSMQQTSQTFTIGIGALTPGTRVQTSSVFDSAFIDVDGNGTVTSITADGSTGTTNNITGAITISDYNTFRIVRNSTNVYFYVNGSLAATHTTNLPNSTATGFFVQADKGNGAATPVSSIIKGSLVFYCPF